MVYWNRYQTYIGAHMGVAPLLGEGLRGHGVVVTGAASGIGREVARIMADVGAVVCAVDIDRDGLTRTVDGLGDDHFAIPFDLRNSDDIEGMLTDAVTRLGSFRALVHAAAYLRREPVASVTSASWDAHVDVNLKATFFLNRTAGQLMAAAGRGGRIVNFTTAAWLSGPLFGSDVYVSTKTGVLSLTRGFARQLGGAGVTVNVIAPGQIDTPMQHRDNDPDVIARSQAACPLGRLGGPAEVAKVAVFLASDNASFVSGATITVSGAGSLY